MNFCIDAEQLRKALADIEVAEKNGFKYCLAVFRLTSCGYMIDDNRATYSDMIEKADPTNGNLCWGRFQSVTKNNKFKNGKLIPIKRKEAQR
jgi:hypothetical protein